MKSETLKTLKVIIKELDFLRKTVIIQWNAWKKDLLLFTNKLTEKIRHPHNANQSFIRKKNTKSVKQPKIITQQPNTSENPNIVDIKPVVTEHP